MHEVKRDIENLRKKMRGRSYDNVHSSRRMTEIKITDTVGIMRKKEMHS